MWLSPVGAARVVSTHCVFHTAAWPSEVDDALDAVEDVVKNGFFHVLETVWALDAAEGVSRDRFFHVSGAFHVLCDRLTVRKGGAFHALPVATLDS